MVSSSTSISSRLALWGTGLVVFGCQGGNLTLPSDGAPTNLVAVSGWDQQGTIGEKLPKPLVVQLTDAAGRPIPDATLRFETEVPAAQVEPATIETNDKGEAAVTVRLGSLEGTQTVHAHLEQDPDLRTTFALTALARDKGGGNDGGDNGGNGDDDDDRGRGNGRDHGGGHGHGEDDD